MRRLVRALAIALLILAAGCTANSRSDTLTATLNAYQSTLRWGDIRSAEQFVDPDYRAAHPLSAFDLARFGQVRVSEYDAGAGPVPVNEGEVRQSVVINLINEHTQSERSIVDHQTWRWDAATKHWWLTSGLPDISRE